MAALAGVTADIKELQRNGWNAHNSYDYATIDDIFSELRSRLGKANIDFAPTIKSHEINSKEKGGKVQTVCLLTLGMTFTHGEDGSSMEATWIGEAMDTSDKAVSKAISMAVKSYLKAKFLLSTGDDDPDSDSPEGIAHPRQTPKNETPGDEPEAWTAQMENAVRRQESFSPFRDICRERGYDPVDVAKQAFGEGVTVKSDLITYAENMPKVGPIEVSTIDAISDLLKALDYGTVSKPNSAGTTAIRQILQIATGDSVPAIKRLNESEGVMIVRNLKAEADKQKS